MKRHFLSGTTAMLLALVAGLDAQAVEEKKGEVNPKSTAAQYAAANSKATPEVNMADVSYCIGLSFGKSIRGQQIEIDLNAFQEGIEHGFDETDPKLSIDQIREVMNNFQESLIQKQIESEKKAAKSAIEEEKQFLENNKSKEGVSSTESGLQYRVIKTGDGHQPSAKDLVTVHYHGTLPDGTVFDSSYERGEPVTFPLSRVIAGWSEALQLMKEGDKWQLYIPSHLAYGPQGAGGEIGPHQPLVFEVELIKVGAAGANAPASTPGVG